MFEKFLSTGTRDFVQRYEGTFGFYRKEDKSRLLVQLSGIGENSCNFVDAKGINYSLNADTDKDIGFEFLPPKSGYHNTDKGAILVQRTPARQWQRGISHKNTSLQVMTMGFLRAERVDIQNLERIYEKALTITEARRRAKADGKVTSVAISSQICMDVGVNALYVLQESIGTFMEKDNVFTVTLNDKNLFRTEVADAFKAMGCQVQFT
jgi:hypothetical protein